MTSVTEIADEYWTALKARDPFYAVKDGGQPENVGPLDETAIHEQSDQARSPGHADPGSR